MILFWDNSYRARQLHVTIFGTESTPWQEYFMNE